MAEREGRTRGKQRSDSRNNRKRLPMRTRLAICIVLIVGCALLAIPTEPARQASHDHLSSVAFAQPQTSSALLLVAARGIGSAAKCNSKGYPCDLHGYSCCPGLVCVFRGGSTRSGYQCWPKSERASTGSSQKELNASKLERDALAEFLR